VAGGVFSSLERNCYFRYQNPALLVAGRAGGEEEDGRRTALNTTVGQGGKAPKFGLSPSKAATLPRPGVSHLTAAVPPACDGAAA